MDPRFFLPCFHGPRASRLGHKRKEKTRSITCRTDRANEANKRYNLTTTVYRFVAAVSTNKIKIRIYMHVST